MCDIRVYSQVQYLLIYLMGIQFEFARLKLVLLRSHMRREFNGTKIFWFESGNQIFIWFMHPSINICWARHNVFFYRVEYLVWIVQCCQAAQAETADIKCHLHIWLLSHVDKMLSKCSTNFEWRRHDSPKLLIACPKHKINYIIEVASDVAFQQY